jgi:hypothetical protein
MAYTTKRETLPRYKGFVDVTTGSVDDGVSGNSGD